MWSRVDDSIPHHPKFIKAGPIASWLWVCGNCHCTKYLTDGFIEVSVVKGLGHIPQVYRHADTLVRVGLWERCDNGYRVHDYDQYNPTAEEVQRLRVVRAEQGRRGGLAKSLAIRQAKGQRVAKQSAKQASGKNVADIDIDPKKSTEHSSVAEPKNAPPVTEFLTWFQEEYKKRRDGATYCVVWAKHGAIVKRLLHTYSAERLRRHAVVLLTATVDEYIDQSDRGIEVLAGKINWLEERLCVWEKQKHAREAV